MRCNKPSKETVIIESRKYIVRNKKVKLIKKGTGPYGLKRRRCLLISRNLREFMNHFELFIIYAHATIG